MLYFFFFQAEDGIRYVAVTGVQTCALPILPILLDGDKPLLNIYSVMEVNPSNGPKVNTAGGNAFADFMVSADVQKIVKTFGVDKYGQALFVPVAGMNEEEVGGP